MSYALAAYALVVGGITAYAAWLASARRALRRELGVAPAPKSRLTAEQAELYKLMGS